MALPLDDFFRRITGQPMNLPGSAMASGRPVNAQTPTAATVAQPSLEQLQSQDYQRAAMQRMGQLGMLLMAAGQRMTPRERATILAQAPQFMDGMQAEAAQAAQARLLDMSTRAKQQEMSRAEDIDKQAPALANALGLSPELRQALTPEQMRELYIKRMMADPRESKLVDLKLQEAQAQVDALRAPKPMDGTIVEMADGSKAFLPKGTTTPMPIPGTGQAPKPPTKEQADAFGFASRISKDLPILQDQKKIDAGTSIYNQFVSNIPLGFGNQLAGGDYQQFDQAQRDFINAVLRRESGAAISPSEFASANLQYFPQPGDKPETVQQKLRNQKTQLEAIMYGMVPEDRKRLQQEIDGQNRKLPAGVRSITPIQ